MPAKSKSQQRLFGMVHAYQKGELKGASDEVKDIAKSISKKDAEDFAETKHKGLPNKVKKTKTNENMKKDTINESLINKLKAIFFKVFGMKPDEVNIGSVWVRLYRKYIDAVENGDLESLRSFPDQVMGLTPKQHQYFERKIDELINYHKMNESKNMKKNAIKLNENTLRKMIRKALLEVTLAPDQIDAMNNTADDIYDENYPIEDILKDTMKDWKAAVKNNPSLLQQAKEAVKSGEYNSIEEYVYDVWADRGMWAPGYDPKYDGTDYMKNRKEAETNAAWSAYDIETGVDSDYDLDDPKYWDNANKNIYNSNDFENGPIQGRVSDRGTVYNFDKDKYLHDFKESRLSKIVSESVKKVLKEQEDPDYDPYVRQQEMPMEQPQPAEELNTLQDVSAEIYRTLEGYYYNWEGETKTRRDELLYNYCKKYVALYEQMK